ncbi:MAG TPA: hypothetical protein VEK82_08415 [Stellaceae bacterium]|nr:hypothetical protein [Stellaceae bacterium]
MPRYVVERQFLVPMYEHIFVEAPDLETACRQALDDFAQPWSDDAKLDWDGARDTTVAQAVEIPEGVLPEMKSAEVADQHDLSLVLYDSGLDFLPIPNEFADPPQEDDTGVGFS